MILAYVPPAAYVSRIHHEAPYLIPECTEIPHPDDEYISVLVNSVTGGPNEASHVPEVNFTIAQVMPLGKPEFAPNYPHAGRVQTRALGQARYSPQKMPRR
jgi:hypothetical protein